MPDESKVITVEDMTAQSPSPLVVEDTEQSSPNQSLQLDREAIENEPEPESSKDSPESLPR